MSALSMRRAALMLVLAPLALLPAGCAGGGYGGGYDDVGVGYYNGYGGDYGYWGRGYDVGPGRFGGRGWGGSGFHGRGEMPSLPGRGGGGHFGGGGGHMGGGRGGGHSGGGGGHR